MHRIALTCLALLSHVAPVFAQDPPRPPAGWVLVDDMYLPEDVVFGDSAFNAQLWPAGYVPFTFHTNVSAENRANAFRAMAEIRGVSSVLFLPRTNQPNWIEFEASNVNQSHVGMAGGKQTIFVTSWQTKCIIVHEIMHALGFVHEHCRPDRDNFVSINWNNIQTGQTENFTMINQSSVTLATAYDFLSVMHYGRTAFSSNGMDTVTCHPAYAQFQGNTLANPGIGNRIFLSLPDADGLQQRYGTPFLPTLTQIAPTFVTTSLGPFTLHAYGSDFFEGSPNANGVQGTKIRWNGTILPTTWVDSGHVTAEVPASLLTQPQTAQISVVNPAPGAGAGLNSLPLAVNCFSGNVVLSPGSPVVTSNGCQGYSIGTPAQDAFNVVAVASPSNWNIQMGTATAASPSITCDFVAGSGFFGPGTVQPTNGNVSLGSSVPPVFAATLQYEVSTPVLTGQPTIASMPAGSIVRAFHFDSQGLAGRTISVSGPTNLNWKLLWEGNSFGWRSSTSNVLAQGQVGGPPVTALGIVPSKYCLVVYRNAGPSPTTVPLTVTMCFDFTPTQLFSSNNILTVNQGPYSCRWFNISPLGGHWNVVGVSSPTDWDIQIGPAVSQFGGPACDYVLANGHLGTVTPVLGVTSPYAIPGSPGSLQFAPTATLASFPGGTNSYAYMMVAFEFLVSTPGNYDVGALAPGMNWDLHRPGTNATWRAAADRIAGPFPADGAARLIADLQPGWHCVVLYRNGGPSPTLINPSMFGGLSATQPPVLAAITPDTIASQGGPFYLTAGGSGFTPTSQIRWNGSPLPTTYVSETELSATVPAALIAAPGSASVTVLNPGAGTSSALPLTIGSPVPSLTSLSQTYAVTGEPTLTLSISGSGFVPATVVRWNGTPMPSTYVNAGQLDLVLHASFLSAAGTWSINVVNPPPAGGESNYLYLLTYGPLAYVLTPSSITTAAATSGPFTVGVHGAFLTPWSVVHANGVALPTTYFDPNNIEALLDPAVVPQAGLPGAIGICVVNTMASVSNLLPLVVEGGNNVGLIRADPVVPTPGYPLSFLIDGGPAFAPVTLIADLGAPSPVAHWPNTTLDFVLGVTELAGSSGVWLPLADGLGLVGPPDASAFDAVGVFRLAGFTMPHPALHVDITLQAAYIDSGTPGGLSLSWPLHVFRL